MNKNRIKLCGGLSLACMLREKIEIHVKSLKFLKFPFMGT